VATARVAASVDANVTKQNGVRAPVASIGVFMLVTSPTTAKKASISEELAVSTFPTKTCLPAARGSGAEGAAPPIKTAELRGGSGAAGANSMGPAVIGGAGAAVGAVVGAGALPPPVVSTAQPTRSGLPSNIALFIVATARVAVSADANVRKQ